MCFLGAYWNPLGCCTVQFGEKAFMSTKNSRIPWSIRASSSRIHVTRWHFQRKAPITSISFRTGKFTWKHKPHHAIWQNNYAGALIQHHPSHKTSALCCSLPSQLTNIGYQFQHTGVSPFNPHKNMCSNTVKNCCKGTNSSSSRRPWTSEESINSLLTSLNIVSRLSLPISSASFPETRSEY